MWPVASVTSSRSGSPDDVSGTQRCVVEVGQHDVVAGRDRPARRRPSRPRPRRTRRRRTRRRSRCGTAARARSRPRTRSARRRWPCSSCRPVTASCRAAESSLCVSRCRGSSGWFGRACRSATWSSPVAGTDDRGRQVPVVEQRRVVGEALDAHQLLGVQAAVGVAELGVPLARDLADLAVVRHRLSCPVVSRERPLPSRLVSTRHPDRLRATVGRPAARARRRRRGVPAGQRAGARSGVRAPAAPAVLVRRPGRPAAAAAGPGRRAARRDGARRRPATSAWSPTPRGPGRADGRGARAARPGRPRAARAGRGRAAVRARPGHRRPGCWSTSWRCPVADLRRGPAERAARAPSTCSPTTAPSARSTAPAAPTAGAVPSAAELAGFLRAALDRRLSFKLTAGLHHAAARTDGRGFEQHGVLNVLAAVGVGVDGADARRAGRGCSTPTQLDPLLERARRRRRPRGAPLVRVVRLLRRHRAARRAGRARAAGPRRGAAVTSDRGSRCRRARASALSHLPYGVFAPAEGAPRCGVRIGDHVLDLGAVSVPHGHDFTEPALNPFLAPRPAGVGRRPRTGDRAAHRAGPPRHGASRTCTRWPRSRCSCRSRSPTTSTSTPREHHARNVGRDLPARRARRCPPTGSTCRSATTAAPAPSSSRDTGRTPARPAQAAGRTDPDVRTEHCGWTSRPRSASSSACRPRGGPGAAVGLRRPRLRGRACSTTGRRATCRRGSTCRSGRSWASRSRRRCRRGWRRWPRWRPPGWPAPAQDPEPLPAPARRRPVGPRPGARGRGGRRGRVATAVRRDVLDARPAARPPDRQRRLAAHRRPVRVRHRVRTRPAPARLVPRAVLGRARAARAAGGRELGFLEDGDTVVLRATAPSTDGGRISLGQVAGTVLPALGS